MAEGKLVYFVLGGPGCGKGTFCGGLTGAGGFRHFSAGDLLRAFVEEHCSAPEGSESRATSDQIQEFIREGKIVPASVTIPLLLRAISNAPEPRVVVDGFPRSMENFRKWSELCAELGGITVERLILIDCPEPVMLERMQKRAAESKSAQGVRSDDNLLSFKKRMVVYSTETAEVVDVFRKENKLCLLNGNQPPNLVLKDFLDTL